MPVSWTLGSNGAPLTYAWNAVSEAQPSSLDRLGRSIGAAHESLNLLVTLKPVLRYYSRQKFLITSPLEQGRYGHAPPSQNRRARKRPMLTWSRSKRMDEGIRE